MRGNKYYEDVPSKCSIVIIDKSFLLSWQEVSARLTRKRHLACRLRPDRVSVTTRLGSYRRCSNWCMLHVQCILCKR